MASPRELEAMDQALQLAARGLGTASPNPVVGCVLLDDSGAVLGSGFHERAGGPHAEILALAEAGAAARGATAVVTLEPCRHQGRTGPCTKALIDAGVRRVVFAASDPGAESSGGAAELEAAGVEVEGGVLADRADHLNRAWLGAQRHGRPWVTVKLASSLDGRVAAADGSSRWITGAPARADAHRRRALADAVLVGSGTVTADDPSLDVRDVDADLAYTPPLRVVIGHTPVAADARVRGHDDRFLQLSTHDVDEVLTALWQHDVRHVLVEGGPTLVSAFLRSGTVDEVLAYVAPVVIGSGLSAVSDLGGVGIGDALRLSLDTVERIGDDVLITARTRTAVTDGNANDSGEHS